MCEDGQVPRLRRYLNLMSLEDMQPERTLEQVAEAGYEGVQFTEPMTPDDRRGCERLKLRWCSSGRVNRPEEVCELASRFTDEGADCATLHVGWGLEGDDEAGRLIEAILDASATVPLFAETHRATVFQDMWRTVGFVQRYPGLRFNGDFSHWYAGSEMVYGGFERKLAFVQPVLDRTRFIHGRIATPGCIQARASDCALYVEHFREMWIRAFRGFLRTASSDDSMFFVPELLSPRIYYGHDDLDRWSESLVLCRIAEQCFKAAQAEVA
ncbi:MAG TPA: hypothetical protein VES20_05370 [Bryobacteraceae bacterium]|nr:hypothetical protein [Bryobacteraceae bacterium]